MPAIEKKITWTTKSGKHVEVRISFATSRVADADGDRCEVPCCELHIAGEVQGMGVVGYAINRKPVQVAGTTYPATIGKLVESRLSDLPASSGPTIVPVPGLDDAALPDRLKEAE